jgi:hypothetical protein
LLETAYQSRDFSEGQKTGHIGKNTPGDDNTRLHNLEAGKGQNDNCGDQTFELFTHGDVGAGYEPDPLERKR